MRIPARSGGARTSSIWLWVGYAIVAAILWGLAFAAPLFDIFRLATGDIERSYLLFAPAVAAYLAFLRRSRSSDLRYRSPMLGCLMVLVGILASAFGKDRDIIMFWHGGAVVSLIGVFVSVFGSRCLTRFLPAFVVLFALVPVPGSVRQALARPLQRMATEITSLVLEILGVSVEQAGNLLKINGQLVAVGEACDGMRLLLPLALVIYTFVFSLPLKTTTRLLLIVISMPVAIICNVIRLVPTAIAYGYFPDSAPLIHDIGGWLMIPLAVWILLQLIRLAAWIDLPIGRWRLVGS